MNVQAASAIDGATVIDERFVRCQNMCEVDIVSTLCFHLTCQFRISENLPSELHHSMATLIILEALS